MGVLGANRLRRDVCLKRYCGFSTQARNGTCCRRATQTTKLCIGAFRLGAVVREIYIGLVDLVDEDDARFAAVNGGTEWLQADVWIDILRLIHAGWILHLLQSSQGVEPVEQILGLRRALDAQADGLAELQLGGDRASQ